MATAAKKTKTPTRVRVSQPVSIVPDVPKPDLGDLVQTIVPKTFTLTRDGGVPITYHAGFVNMPRSDAEHWWSKAQGVEIKS